MYEKFHDMGFADKDELTFDMFDNEELLNSIDQAYDEIVLQNKDIDLSWFDIKSPMKWRGGDSGTSGTSSGNTDSESDSVAASPPKLPKRSFVSGYGASPLKVIKEEKWTDLASDSLSW